MKNIPFISSNVLFVIISFLTITFFANFFIHEYMKQDFIDELEITNEQKVLIQRYTVEASMSIISLTMNDVQNSQKLKQDALITKKMFEKIQNSFLESGEINKNGKVIVIPKITDQIILTKLNKIRNSWNELNDCIEQFYKIEDYQNKALYKKDFPEIQKQSLKLLTLVEEANALIAENNKKSKKKTYYFVLVLVFGFILFLFIVFFLIIKKIIPNLEILYLKDLKERLSNYFNQTKVGIVEWNDDYNITEWNPASEIIFGYKKTEIIHKNIESVFSQTKTINKDNFVNRLIPMFGEQKIVNKNITKEGKEIICEWYCTPSVLSKNKGEAGSAIVLDVTERLMKQDELNRTNISLKAINKSQEELFNITDINVFMGNICSIFTEIMGFKCSWISSVDILDSEFNKDVEVIASSHGNCGCLKLQLNELDDSLKNESPIIKSIVSQKTVIINELKNENIFKSCAKEIHSKDGSRSFISLPIIFNNLVFGSLSILSSSSNDFNEQTINAINQVVKNLTIGIFDFKNNIGQKHVTEQIEHTEKMKIMGQLTGGIAHDFNNILASILGFTNIALRISQEDKDTKLLNSLSEIKKATKRASGLITQLLTFSRAHKLPEENKKISLCSTVEESITMLNPAFLSNIEIKTELKNNLPKIIFDSNKLSQILLNLLVNLLVNSREAISRVNTKGLISVATKEETIQTDSSSLISINELSKEQTLFCSSCFNEIKGNYVKLTIEDNGGGISREVKKNIFTPFFSTKEINQASGMGLSIVHGILHQFDAHIVVNNIEKKGKVIGLSIALYFPY